MTDERLESKSKSPLVYWSEVGIEFGGIKGL